MAPLTEDDRTLIRNLRIEKHLNAYQMIMNFLLETGVKTISTD